MPVLRLARKATELQQAGDVKRSRHRLVGVPVGQVDDAGLDEVEAIEEPGRSTRGCKHGKAEDAPINLDAQMVIVAPNAVELATAWPTRLICRVRFHR